MPSLNTDILIEIFHYLIDKHQRWGIIESENLTKFIICGKSNLKVVENYFFKANSVDVLEKSCWFRAKHIRKDVSIFKSSYNFFLSDDDHCKRYRIEHSINFLPLLSIIGLCVQQLNIIQYPNDKKIWNFLIKGIIKITCPYDDISDYSKLFMKANSMEAIEFNSWNGTKLIPINLPSSCKKLKFNNMPFETSLPSMNNFRKSSSSSSPKFPTTLGPYYHSCALHGFFRTHFPFIENLEINGFFQNFEINKAKNFIEFIFRGFPNLKLMNIKFQSQSTISSKKEFLELLELFDDEIKWNFFEHISNVNGTIAFLIDYHSSDGYDLVKEKFIFLQILEPSRGHNKKIVKTTYKISKNVDVIFVFSFPKNI